MYWAQSSRFAVHLKIYKYQQISFLQSTFIPVFYMQWIKINLYCQQGLWLKRKKNDENTILYLQQFVFQQWCVYIL